MDWGQSWNTAVVQSMAEDLSMVQVVAVDDETPRV